MTLGDLRLYPDGRIELGPHRFSGPSQVQPIPFFELYIYPSSKSNQDVLVEYEGECFVFRFVPSPGQWKKQSITREQLQQLARQEQPQAVPAIPEPCERSLQLPTQARAQESQPAHRIFLEEASPPPPRHVQGAAPTGDLPIIRTHYGVAQGQKSDHLHKHEPRRFVAKGAGGEAARTAQAFVDRLRRIDPKLKIGLAEYGMQTISQAGFEAYQILTVRCIRLLHGPAHALVDVVFQHQGEDLSVSLSHYDYSPARFCTWVNNVSLLLFAGGIGTGSFVAVAGPICELIDLDAANAWGIASGASAIVGLVFSTIFGNFLRRDLHLEEEQLSKALPDLMLSCLEDVVGARHLQEVE